MIYLCSVFDGPMEYIHAENTAQLWAENPDVMEIEAVMPEAAAANG